MIAVATVIIAIAGTWILSNLLEQAGLIDTQEARDFIDAEDKNID